MADYVREPTLYDAWQVTPDDAAAIADWCGGQPVDQGVQVESTWGTLVIPHGCWVVYDVNSHEFDMMSDRYFQQVCFQQRSLSRQVLRLGLLLGALVVAGITLALVL